VDCVCRGFGDEGCYSSTFAPPNRRQQRLRPRQAPPTQGPLTIYALIVVGAGGWHAGLTTVDGHALPDADRRARCVQIVVGRWEYVHAEALGFDHQGCRALWRKATRSLKQPVGAIVYQIVASAAAEGYPLCPETYMPIRIAVLRAIVNSAREPSPQELACLQTLLQTWALEYNDGQSFRSCTPARLSFEFASDVCNLWPAFQIAPLARRGRFRKHLLVGHPSLSLVTRLSKAAPQTKALWLRNGRIRG
jgi:hypothetical protein